MALVEAKGITVRLGKRIALDHVDFSIDAGEIVTVVGPNGSGKTTLLRSIIGAVRPASGVIRQVGNLRIGYVPQRIHIDPTLPLTVRRFLSLPVRRDADKIDTALYHAGILGLAERQISDLSGGQFQRVMLARALMEKPQLLLLDEPTTGLDQPGSASFYRQIEQVRNELGCAVLLVSHELHVVMSASDRVVCLNHHVCCHGTPEIVASAPEYRELFGSGTKGALALYRHEHNHDHNHDHDHEHEAAE